jgi:hypothetical protein
LPGSLWDLVLPGQTIFPREASFEIRIVNVKGDTIKVIDSFGVPAEYSRSEWPGEFLPSWKGHQTDRVLRALLVGGEGGHHLSRLKELAAQLGVDITHHISGHTKANRMQIPVGTEVVIILASNIGHPLARAAVDHAKRAEVAHVTLPSSGFQAQLWEGLRDWFPEMYPTAYYGSGPRPSVGPKAKPIPPSTITMVMRDDGTWVPEWDATTVAPPALAPAASSMGPAVTFFGVLGLLTLGAIWGVDR